MIVKFASANFYRLKPHLASIKVRVLGDFSLQFSFYLHFLTLKFVHVKIFL